MYSYYCCNHPLRESHEWPKHVGGHYVIQLHSLKQREFVCFFLNKFYASNMKLKLIYYILMNRNKKLSSKIKYFILFYFILFYCTSFMHGCCLLFLPKCGSLCLNDLSWSNGFLMKDYAPWTQLLLQSSDGSIIYRFPIKSSYSFFKQLSRKDCLICLVMYLGII